MQFVSYWQQFEHTGRVEDYLSYLQSAENSNSAAVKDGTCRENCRAEGSTVPDAGEDETCRNPCM